jgi:hypothetical protein
MDYSSLIGPALNLVGGIAGGAASAGDRGASMGTTREAADLFRTIKPPDVKDQELALNQYQLQGLVSSLLQGNAEQLGPAAAANISTDPAYKAAQMQALQKLQETSKSGLTPQEQAQAQRMAAQAQAQEGARQASIIQNMASRGVAGSGVEAAARLASSQQAANAAATSSDDLRAQAYARMLASTSQAGDLGSKMQTNEFNQKSSQAQAADNVAKFNLQQRSDVIKANLDRQRQVEAANLAARQGISNTNTGLANSQQEYNKKLLQQQFDNQMNRASGLGGKLGTLAAAQNNAANATANQYSGIASGIGAIASAYGAQGGSGGGSGGGLASTDISDTAKGKSLLDGVQG